MPLVKDRVKQTTTTTGTGTVALSGTVSGFQTFAQAFSSGSVVYYCIADGSNWESGIGTYTTGSPGSLSRDTILDSSNGGAAVAWGVGTKDVFVTLPAAAVNTSGLMLPHTSVRSVAYTVQASDAGRIIPCTGTWALTLLAATSLTDGTPIGVENRGTGTISIVPSGSDKINGAGAIIIRPGNAVLLASGGSAGWTALGGFDRESELWSTTDKAAAIVVNSSALVASTSSQRAGIRGTLALPTNRACYWETIADATAVGFVSGIARASANLALYLGEDGAGWGYSANGNLLNSANAIGTAPSYSNTAIIGHFYDPMAGKFWWSLNGTVQTGGNPSTGANPAVSGLSGALYPAWSSGIAGSGTSQVSARFSSSSWSHSSLGFSAIV